MTTWVRHTWMVDEPCCPGRGEAYVESGSLSDEQLRQCFQSTREVAVDVVRTVDDERLMNGWIRFG